MTVLSFSILTLILFSCSTCSCISAVASACFFLRPTMVASCWILASSRSLLSLLTSASLFLLSSIRALVAPLASPSLSPRFSSSLARSDLCLSALALPCLSASSSSSISSILAWTSLMVFWTLATRDCSSSSLLIRDPLSFSLRWMAPSSSFLVLSSSETVSCMILSSPSIFLLSFSMLARPRQHREGEEEDRGRAENHAGDRLRAGEDQEGAGERHPAQGEGQRLPDEQAGGRAVPGRQGPEDHQGGPGQDRGDGGGAGG